jgi:hypothetical protein
LGKRYYCADEKLFHTFISKKWDQWIILIRDLEYSKVSSVYMYMYIIYSNLYPWNIVEKKKKLLIHLELFYVFIHWIPILYKNWKYKYAFAECIYRIITNNHFFISKGDGTGPMRIEVNGSSFRTSLTSIPIYILRIIRWLYHAHDRAIIHFTSPHSSCYQGYVQSIIEDLKSQKRWSYYQIKP